MRTVRLMDDCLLMKDKTFFDTASPLLLLLERKYFKKKGKRYSLEWMHHVFSSSSAVSTSALIAHEAKQSPTENVGEDVVHATAATAAFPEALLPIAVIQLAFLRV